MSPTRRALFARVSRETRPWTVRLYPERHSTLFVRVRVWPTKTALLAHLNIYDIAADGRGFGKRCNGAVGTSLSWRLYPKRSGKPRRRSACVAEVSLWRGALGVGVIAHELFHATMAWAHRVQFPHGALNTPHRGDAPEERIAAVHGELCRQFVAKGLRPGGFYTDGDTVAGA